MTLVATIIVLEVTPTSATAASCASAVIDDWYGNSRVDKRYPLHCYREAVASLPTDQKDYMHAEDDILRALAYAKRGRNDPGITTPTSARRERQGVKTTTPGPGSAAQPPTAPASQQTTVAADELDDAGAAGIPLPLLLLGGLAVVLLVAGGAGVVSRRFGRGSGTDES